MLSASLLGETIRPRGIDYSLRMRVDPDVSSSFAIQLGVIAPKKHGRRVPNRHFPVYQMCWRDAVNASALWP